MRPFVTAFSIGLLAFALINVGACLVRSDDSDDPDATTRWGFPFLFSEEIMMPDVRPFYFNRTALWGDIALAVVTSGTAAWVYGEVRRRERGNPFYRHEI